MLAALLFAPYTTSAAPDWFRGDAGVDRPGLDLDGSPVTFLSPDATACGALGAATPGCVVWAQSTCAAPFNCSLKFGAPNATNSSCATSGFSPRALAPLAHAPLPCGSLAPAGWLRDQLQLEAVPPTPGELTAGGKNIEPAALAGSGRWLRAGRR